MKPEHKYFDVYEEKELRFMYRLLYPNSLFDEDCWFPFASLPLSAGRTVYLLDGSLSLAEATGDPEASHFPFYSDKGEERVRAAMAKCKTKFRMSAAECEEASQTGTQAAAEPVYIGVTSGAARKPSDA